MAVKIAIEGLVEREVMHLSYSISQEVDVEGRPTAISRGGQLNVTVKSLNDGNTQLFEWACSPYIAKGGKIEFAKRDGTNMKTLEFEDGYLVEFGEDYSGAGADSAMETFTISAKKLTIGSVSHENSWAD